MGHSSHPPPCDGRWGAYSRAAVIWFGRFDRAVPEQYFNLRTRRSGDHTAYSEVAIFGPKGGDFHVCTFGEMLLSDVDFTRGTYSEGAGFLGVGSGCCSLIADGSNPLHRDRGVPAIPTRDWGPK